MDDTTAWSLEAHIEDINDKTLTKRERIATAAMAAVLSRRSVGGTYEDIAKTATRYADALIKELNNE